MSCNDTCVWHGSDEWSLAEALGDTIMEKYESLYVKLFHLFEKCGGAVAFVCGREVSSIFEVATSGFAAEESPDFKASYYKIGRVNDKFDLYVDNGMTSTACVVGKKGVVFLKIKDYLF